MWRPFLCPRADPEEGSGAGGRGMLRGGVETRLCPPHPGAGRRAPAGRAGTSRMKTAPDRGKKWFLWQLTGNKLAVSNRPLTVGENLPRSGAHEATSSVPPEPLRPHLWHIPTHLGFSTIFTSLLTVWASPCSNMELACRSGASCLRGGRQRRAGFPVAEAQPSAHRDART